MSDEMIRGCRLLDIEIKGDERGQLIALEALQNVPFEIRRAYMIYGNQADVSRGFHAHRRLRQLALCVAGQCRLTLEDRSNRTQVLLDRPNKGMLIGPMVWREMHDFSPDCVMLVLADDHYDESDYIRDYDEFRRLVDD